MKTTYSKYLILVFISSLIVACSTKKNSFVSRNWHSVNTKYNTLYNGGLAFDKGLDEVKLGYQDNFWDILPVERMQVIEDQTLPGQKPKNANFERSETKATKAIQKHSMNIQGNEKNTQMDEAHLMLGKSRYYDQRFYPALEAFNYILYKYSNSDKIYEAKVWREKTNIRLENEALAIINLKKLLKNKLVKNQILADANAILAQAYITSEYNDSAIAPLKIAIEETKKTEEKARYHYILGQLYENLKYNDSAVAEFEKVIEMKRQSPRRYVIQSHAKQAMLNTQTQDSTLFFEKYRKLIEDRENRPFLNVLNYQVANFYNNLKLADKAIPYYNKSLRASPDDVYLRATTYKKLATIYFDKAKYKKAGQYYDSTLTNLVKKNREYFSVAKKRSNLDDVIKYEGVVQNADSILSLFAMNTSQRTDYFNDYILKIKKQDSIAKQIEIKKQQAIVNAGIKDMALTNNVVDFNNSDIGLMPPQDQEKTMARAAGNFGKSKSFYFYNQSTVEFGKIEFKKRWGKRPLKENWRLLSLLKDAKENQAEEENIEKAKEITIIEEENERYKVDFYLNQIKTTQKEADSLQKEKTFANFQLGSIYKEKFQELPLAATKFETVLESNPEERFILPSLYNLFKIIENSNPTKAAKFKNTIITNYPNTRYAQILNGKIIEESTLAGTPNEVYNTSFKKFKNQEYVSVLATLEKSITQFAGDDLIPKFELLKAHTIGKIKGINDFRNAMNYVAVTYPNVKEGKMAEDFLNVSIPQMEQIQLKKDSLSKSWKILYKIETFDAVETKKLQEKIQKYITEKQYNQLTISLDFYTENQNFLVIHGLSSEDFSRFFRTALKEAKDYKITQPAEIISSHNYTVIQFKKNLKEYIELNTF